MWGRKTISRIDIGRLIIEMEAFVQDQVRDADSKANELSAPEYYRSDMQGYSRGLWRMGNELIERLRKLL